MSSSLVWHFADEKATFSRGRVLGHTGLPLYKSSFVAAYSPIFWVCIWKICEMENPVYMIPFKSSSWQRSDISIFENLKWILDVAVALWRTRSKDLTWPDQPFYSIPYGDYRVCSKDPARKLTEISTKKLLKITKISVDRKFWVFFCSFL